MVSFSCSSNMHAYLSTQFSENVHIFFAFYACIAYIVAEFYKSLF